MSQARDENRVALAVSPFLFILNILLGYKECGGNPWCNAEGFLMGHFGALPLGCL